MGTNAPATRIANSNAYELFILVLTLLSLGIMVLLLLPSQPAMGELLQTYDNLICFVFLLDFGLRLKVASSPAEYFVRERGWLDLLGSIPSFGILKYGGLLRLARLSRLARIARLMKTQNRREILDDVLANRSQYAAFITVISAILVLVIASIMVLGFESRGGGNIKTGGDALWWSVVTISTVGYGDFFPVTLGGRITAFFVMLAGVGIIGALASILASVLISPSSSEPAPADAGVTTALEGELRAIRSELEALRSIIERDVA